VGAIGIMQLMPETGEQMAVGDVTQAEANVHAGAKFMSLIMNTAFDDSELTDLDRALFAFAAYNAGPARIARLRRVAAQRGLDPNVWFGNVEVVVAEQVGAETTAYVRHIFKYYVSYTLQLERNEERRRARAAMDAKR
jgi:membrane-bound lytic murein transglycosylase MltF